MNPRGHMQTSDRIPRTYDSHPTRADTTEPLLGGGDGEKRSIICTSPQRSPRAPKKRTARARNRRQQGGAKSSGDETVAQFAPQSSKEPAQNARAVGREPRCPETHTAGGLAKGEKSEPRIAIDPPSHANTTRTFPTGHVVSRSRHHRCSFLRNPESRQVRKDPVVGRVYNALVFATHSKVPFKPPPPPNGPPHPRRPNSRITSTNSPKKTTQETNEGK